MSPWVTRKLVELAAKLLMTVTSPAVLPLPPPPPVLVASAAPLFEKVPATEKPPLPPPPPTDCARMPSELFPPVKMSPVLVTFTVLPVPALLPDPPTLSALELSSMLRAPATEKPPLPPPPPIDCARMPSEPAPSV